mgnify:CR=1 FL=1|tara:strand:- start:609 stop:1346 length:738 start_codon:yes stop_codon:yes gene_type:complete
MNEVNNVVEQEQQVADDAGNPFGEQLPEEYQNDVTPGQSPESETYQVDWETEAKKFQSMHDKQSSENDKMRQDMKYMAEKFAEAQQSNVSNQPKSQSLTEEEFNPWDAYYKPESESYKFRTNQEKQSVTQAVQGEMSKINEQMLLNNTVSELKSKHRLSENEVQSFMNWSTNPTSNLSLDTLINVWRGETGGSAQSNNDSLEAVKSAQEAPRSAGVLQGQPIQNKSEKDQMWDAVLNAGGRTNVL